MIVGSEEKIRDPKRALDLIEEAVAFLPNDAAFRRTQGAALCRAENWAAAATALEKSRQLSADYRADSLALFFLSMARQGLNALNTSPNTTLSGTSESQKITNTKLGAKLLVAVCEPARPL